MLQGKKVVIIGGSSGMGLTGAKKAAEQGAEVIVAGRSKAKLDAAEKAIEGHVKTYTVDLSTEKDTARFFDEIGRFDHLIVTAGGAVGPSAFLESDLSTARAVFDGKFWAQYNAARYGARHINSDGSITFFSGVYSRRPSKGFAALAANNAAIEGLTRALAVELAPIRVNAVSPGLVKTPLYDSIPEDQRKAMYESVAGSLPVGRVGTPEDVAQTMIYLMENGYTTGLVVDVDGGSRLV